MKHWTELHDSRTRFSVFSRFEMYHNQKYLKDSGERETEKEGERDREREWGRQEGKHCQGKSPVLPCIVWLLLIQCNPAGCHLGSHIKLSYLQSIQKIPSLLLTGYQPPKLSLKSILHLREKRTDLILMFSMSQLRWFGNVGTFSFSMLVRVIYMKPLSFSPWPFKDGSFFWSLSIRNLVSNLSFTLYYFMPLSRSWLDLSCPFILPLPPTPGSEDNRRGELGGCRQKGLLCRGKASGH